MKTTKQPLKIVVAGACGRMGRAILAAIQAAPGARLAGALEHAGHPQLGRDAGEAAGLGGLGVIIESDLESALSKGELMIDFTTPKATLEHLAAAEKMGRKMVIGTTGMDAAQARRVERFARSRACVMSSNFSVGVNLLWKAVALVARTTGRDFDVEIVEAHHHFKKDSPSGTALTTARVLAKALGRDLDKAATYGRHTREGSRPPEEIGIHAVRAGDIVGDHTVLFAGPGERLEFVHRAHSRENFASGAVRAALWLRSRKSGLYSMQDVLGLA